MKSIIQLIIFVTLTAVTSLCSASKFITSTDRCNDPYVATGFGPHDFRKYKRSDHEISIVERYHFTSKTRKEALYGLKTIPDHTMGADLDYTLRAIPNNPDAINAMATFQIRDIKKKLNYFSQPRKFMPAYCYFNRAIAFAPDDVNMYNLYGIYLQRIGKLKEALIQFKKVVELEPKSAKSRYNLGLIYYYLKDYKNAVKEAKYAYSNGYKKLHLKKQLQAKGHWK